MVFERLIKGTSGVPSEMISGRKISIRRKSIRFSRELSEWIRNKGSYVEVLFDKSNGKLGFRPTNDPTKGYKFLSDKNNPNGCSFLNCKTSYIKELGFYEPNEVDGMLVVSNVTIPDDKKLTTRPL